MLSLLRQWKKIWRTNVAPVAAAAPAAAGGGDAGGEAEADDAPVDIHLTDVGDKKVDVIKAVRAITGFGLKDAKALVDEAPSVIKEGVVKAEAEEHAKAFKMLEQLPNLSNNFKIN